MVITDINKLAAEFIRSNINHLKDDPDVVLELAPEFYQSWQVAGGQVKTLFSKTTYKKFVEMEYMIVHFPHYRTQEVMDRSLRINKFKEAPNTALNAFYKEIGIL